ncbi:MAG: Mur ligase family protein, partial [Alphaproteobacteria bacterium]
MTHSVQTLLRWLHDDGFSPEVSVPAADGTGAAAAIEADTVITRLCIDSRAVTRGSLFAALPGHQVDGHSFIARALEAGAACVLAQRPPQDDEKAALSGYWITLENSPRALARLAARFYGPLPERLIGVTGTNGKTSVAHFTRLLLDPARCASIGTLGLRPEGLFALPGLTSPDALSLAQALGAAAAAGMDHAVLEASSHGLEQGRLAGLDFTVAGFTHLSRDHLDYHETMDAYWQAKRSLFTRHLTPGARVVVDERLPQARELAALGLDLFRL